ncbi:calcineurin-like phosphoesterase-like [Hordeum vulgare]|nr:calcineurin-like phosphoesterase-like [Hordeum vulgare]
MHFGNGAATRCRDVAPEVGGARCSDLNTTRFLRRLIEAERPDLIAFTATKASSLIEGDEEKEGETLLLQATKA